MGSDEYRDKLKSLALHGDRSTRGPKITTEVNEHATVDFTEHDDGRVDVTVKPKSIAVVTQQGTGVDPPAALREEPT